MVMLGMLNQRFSNATVALENLWLNVPKMTAKLHAGYDFVEAKAIEEVHAPQPGQLLQVATLMY